jgi:small subunit ribosomal protein S3
MGQKVHPYGFRLGVIKTWNSKWFEDKNYAKWLHEDVRIKRAVKEYLMNANIASVEVERAANKAKVIVFTARPGMVIGKGGKGIEILKIGNLKTAAKGETKFPGVQSFTENEVFIDVQEIRKAETSAQLVAENVAMQLERRVAFRRAMKKSMMSTMKFGAKGIRVECSGRLGGSEMSRRERYAEGRVPLHTLRADIEFGLAEAKTTYGVIGVKCWIFKGDVSDKELRSGPLALRNREEAQR